jgi:hypothetical protein
MDYIELLEIKDEDVHKIVLQKMTCVDLLVNQNFQQFAHEADVNKHVILNSTASLVLSVSLVLPFAVDFLLSIINPTEIFNLIYRRLVDIHDRDLKSI